MTSKILLLFSHRSTFPERVRHRNRKPSPSPARKIPEVSDGIAKLLHTGQMASIPAAIAKSMI